mgnify:CR=1 FL=1
MNPKVIFILLISLLFTNISSKSQDYGRHIELSLLFYECQRSGPLPKTNRIWWRHDSMVDAGADEGLDLTGGYYDAGDNCKFNFPGAASMTLLAWSGIEFKKGYKSAGQYEILLDTVKWGTDYFIKCHPKKDVLYVGVGDGLIDHGFWYPPEYINYEYPSFKVDSKNPGTEVAGETAASLASASILFKEEDSSYSATLLKHAIEIYDFADTYRGDYTKSVKNVQNYYGSYSGYNDELAWGAMWLYYATGEEKYFEKFKAIADASYGEQDPKKYPGSTGPISWDDKRPGCYILSAIVTKDEKRMEDAYKYCDAILKEPRTPGGLWYDKGLSNWASNRYASNAAAMLAVFANHLPESDSKRKSYIDFVKSQMDYILGDNPAGVNYVVGAEDNSPKAVHHRGASGTFDSMDKNAKPEYNIFTLYGALAGGPGGSDNYKDDRSNYEMNEVALDYNAGFTLCLASLMEFGLGKKDGPLDFDRAWPPKPPTPDITVEIDAKTLSISTGSGMLCSSWCVSFTADIDLQAVYDATAYKMEKPNYIICNRRESNFLDGEGTPQVAKLQINGADSFKAPTEFEVLCDGFHAPASQKTPTYKPEYGHKYKVTSPGGPENTKPLYEVTKCWPSFVC